MFVVVVVVEQIFLSLTLHLSIHLLLPPSSHSDASPGLGPAGSETPPAAVSQPAVPAVAHRAAGRGQGEGTEDPVHLPEGQEDSGSTGWERTQAP